MPIKVLIQTDKYKGGPGVFRSRLIFALSKCNDIKIITDVNDKFDIELVFIKRKSKHNKPYILRIDNCYYIKRHKAYNNKPIEKTIRNSKYVIFQSKFITKLCTRVLRLGPKYRNGKNLRYLIIYNGIDLGLIENIELNNKIIPGSFVACARWDSNKRPFSTIKGFIEADIKRHLYVIGNQGVDGATGLEKKLKKYNSKYIHILGEKSNKETLSIMKACDYQIHLCHMDACPNIVLEGLACGLNVLCTNLGGTQELVQDNGVVLNVDKFWDTRYMKPKDVDNVGSKIVAEGIRKLMKRKKEINFDKKFDINYVAKRYIKVIKKGLG